jgi:hypothetical protein
MDWAKIRVAWTVKERHDVSMDLYIHLALTVAYIIVIYMAVRKLSEARRVRGRILLLLVMLGLLYDNAVIALGTSLRAGDLLESLHAWRYWAHAWLTPLIVLIALDIWQQERLAIARSRLISALAWLITIALIAYQTFLARDEVRTLRAVREFGVIRYEPANTIGSPAMIIVVTLVLIITAILLLLYRGWWWLAIGIALMPFIMWLQLPLGGRGWENVAEFVLTLAIWGTLERRLPMRLFA